MNCSNCGKELNGVDDKFCSQCGTPKDVVQDIEPNETTNIGLIGLFMNGSLKISSSLIFCYVLQILALVISCTLSLFSVISIWGTGGYFSLFNSVRIFGNPEAERLFALIYIAVFIFSLIFGLMSTNKLRIAIIIELVSFLVLMYALHSSYMSFDGRLVIEFQTGFYATIVMLILAFVVSCFSSRKKPTKNI